MAKRLRQPSMTACQSVSAHECRQEAAPEVVGRVWSARCGFGLRCCLEKLLRARSRACIVIITRIPSICPASAGHFFAVANCCYRRSRRRLVGSLLDECLLDAVTNLGVHRTPRRLCGRLNAAAQLVIKADIEPRWLLPIVRMHGHPIQCRGGTLGYDQITSRVRSGRLRRSATTADRKSTRLNSSHLGISYAVFCLKKKKQQKQQALQRSIP